VSSAVSRPSRFISYTVKMTRQCGAEALISGRARAGLELSANACAGADLLGEHLIALDAGLGERVQLRLEFLGERRGSGVPDADVTDSGQPRAPALRDGS
jgi:hypothetical protein